ncbi:EfeM/EfeO family lipoprotein [Leifsonia shinshuensis]|uniref:EfeM/EfeO family lipoprotein n=1 Tax=Leifsonia shinshuensis TaxID=150026 RepID=UPI001F50DE02|nr:EfeM/EfeO family lipoprotein [Leifsonia shinshuensis]MCI0157004.1 EfeM/EfeO family lipoprotein [Leifsonia shinshuensis]
MSTRARLTALFGVLAAVVAVVIVLALAARPAAVSAAPSSEIAVAAGLDDCGDGWGDGGRAAGGTAAFDVDNTTVGGVEVYLQAVDTQKVYLDLESIGAGAHAHARVTLGSGRYRFVCLPADADPVRGPTVAVGPAPRGSALTPGIVPVTRADLIPAAQAYGAWVASRLPALRRQAAAVAADAEEGDLAAARRDWLTAHSTYETLGAAYGAFGEVGDAIDGLPGHGLTGFHAVEAPLYTAAPASAVVGPAQKLVADIDRLIAAFPSAQIDPGDMGLRAHEIVEDALRDVLAGAADAGSGTELATIDANLSGARQALAPLHDILASRYPDLAATQQSITTTQTLVEGFRGADGTWTRLSALTTAQREHVDAALSETAELLAPVAAICAPRRNP